MALPEEMTAPLLDPARFDEAVEGLPLGMGRMFHACTHDTIAPTVVRGGTKLNVIPDSVTLEVDIRTLPGQTGDGVRAMLDDALGDLASAVDVDVVSDDPSSASPMETPLWDLLARITPLVRGVVAGAVPDGRSHRRPGSSAAWGPRPTGSDCSARRSASTTSPPCSTGTTSGSTSSRCASRPSSGRPWPGSC